MPSTSRAAPELIGSITLIALIVAGATVGLLFQGNWPKTVRVLAASATYLGVCGVVLACTSALRGEARRLPYWPFWFAGAAAGLVSAVVRPTTTAYVILIQTLSAALLLGGVHWVSVRWWRRMRSTLGL